MISQSSEKWNLQYFQSGRLTGMECIRTQRINDKLVSSYSCNMRCCVNSVITPQLIDNKAKD